jgi:hypothetical protein
LLGNYSITLKLRKKCCATAGVTAEAANISVASVWPNYAYFSFFA